jgi:hypothetical protein
MMIAKSKQCNIALFVDYENVAKQNGHRLESILEQARAEGCLVMLRAYADWGRFSAHKKRLQAIGFELIEVPSNNGKNSADIKLTVDALETAFTKDFIDAFVIVSGDSDFVPLVVKLNELNRRAWLYVANTTASSMLQRFCHRLVLAKPDQKTRNSPEANIADAPQNVSSPPTKPLAEATLRTVAWAIQACHEVSIGPHPLPWLFAAIQRIDPSFDLCRQMGTRKRVRVRLANYLRDGGLIELEYDRGRNQYYFRGTNRAKRLAVEATPEAERMASATEELQARMERARVLAEKTPTIVNQSGHNRPTPDVSCKPRATTQLSLFDD